MLVSEIKALTSIPVNTFHRRVVRHGGDADVAVSEWIKNGRGKRVQKATQ